METDLTVKQDPEVRLRWLARGQYTSQEEDRSAVEWAVSEIDALRQRVADLQTNVARAEAKLSAATVAGRILRDSLGL